MVAQEGVDEAIAAADALEKAAIGAVAEDYSSNIDDNILTALASGIATWTKFSLIDLP
ncbi:MAG: hypothetical protein ACLFQ7_15790 [Phormidium sp.]